MNTTAVTQPSPRRRATLAQREARLAYAMLLPTLLIVVFIVIFPVAWNIWLAFKPIKLGGLQAANLWTTADLTFTNFVRVFRGRHFWPILGTTLTYTILGTILSILGGLAAALIVRDTFPGHNIFRGFLLFPYIAPVVAVAFVWKMMFNAQFGVVNELTTALLNAPRIDFLSLRNLELSLFGMTVKWPMALTMVILFQAWRYFPFAFLFLLARLQALPDDLYEAAAVDGALPSQRFLYITLPQLRGVIGTLFLLRFIWTFNKFDDVFLLTGGGAGTEVITVRVYNYLFGEARVGAAAALSLVLAVILIGFLVLYFRFVATEEE